MAGQRNTKLRSTIVVLPFCICIFVFGRNCFAGTGRLSSLPSGPSLPVYSEYNSVNNPINSLTSYGGTFGQQQFGDDQSQRGGGGSPYYHQGAPGEPYQMQQVQQQLISRNPTLNRQDAGDDGSGIIGLLGLVGLAGLAPFIPLILLEWLPVLGLFLPVLAPALLPLLLPLALPLLLPLLLAPLLLIAVILFLPVPVVSVPATGRGETKLKTGANLETARMVLTALDKGQCIERVGCELSRAAKAYGVNMDKMYGKLMRDTKMVSKVSQSQTQTSSKWSYRLAKGFRHIEIDKGMDNSSDSCKQYKCSVPGVHIAKLLNWNLQ